jgi:hypothetical protein
MSLQEIEEAIANFYVASQDFNGIPETTLRQQLGDKYSREHVKALIEQGRVHLVYERVFANPYIYLLPNLPPDK